MSELLLEIREGIAHVTINRPEAMNAMRSDMWPAMADLLRRVEHDPAVRCVVIAGAGEHFCAGGDVKEFGTTVDMSPGERAAHWMRMADLTNALFLVIERIPQPVITSVRGVAAGGGLALVAASDLSIVAEDARFFAAQIKLGAIPDSGVGYNLVRTIGLKRAKQYSYLGDAFDAATAIQMGLVNWVVAKDSLVERTAELARRLAKVPSVALARTKDEINAAHTRSLSEHFQQEARDVGACVSQDAFADNVRAFVRSRTR
jgi:2-(1,2-epoxy-1,2-dihydrophenyl)acetyl-CoA isomerase